MATGRRSECGGVVDWGSFADWISHKHFLDALRLVSRIAGYVTSNSHWLHVDRDGVAVHSPRQGHAVVKDTKEVPGVVKVSADSLKNAAKVGDKNIAPNTTAADDLRTQAQRWTNKLWESVQAFISCAVVSTALIVNARLAWLMISGNMTESQIAAANSANQNINILASLIIGFYFGRVNHQKEAGVQKGDIGR